LTAVPIKPASNAGFLLLKSALLVLTVPGSVWAQDYVDVEAERRAAEQATEPAALPAVETATSYTGIRPYSGSTTIAQPPADTATSEPITGTDSGSLILRVQQLEEDVRRLTGLLEEATQSLRSLEAQSLERYVDLDRRLGQDGVSAKTDGGAGPTEELAGSAGPVREKANSTGGRAIDAQEGEEAAYRAAYEKVRERDFENAVTVFIDFLSDFPFGRYAPNAHYWLGELYLVVEPPDPELARQNFKLLLDQYPADPKVPDALYKLGRVQFIKGNRQRSREYLDEVIREYPSHAAAQLARQFLLENF
jgi:tol-pal system protein YbgF